MKIKALMPFSNGKISMEQYEVKDVEDTLGEQLVAAGVAVEIGGGSGGGVLVVHDVDGTLDKTWQEIFDAMLSGGAAVQTNETKVYTVITVEGDAVKRAYTVSCASIGDYEASSASDYPTLSE